MILHFHHSERWSEGAAKDYWKLFFEKVCFSIGFASELSFYQHYHKAHIIYLNCY